MAAPPVAMAAEFQRRLQRARVHVIPECRHLPHEEHPDKFNATALQFLDEHVGMARSVLAATHTGPRSMPANGAPAALRYVGPLLLLDPAACPARRLCGWLAL